MLQAGLLAGWAGFVSGQNPDLQRAAELVMKRDFAAAETLLQRILKAQPKSAQALNLSGLVAAERGDLEAA